MPPPVAPQPKKAPKKRKPAPEEEPEEEFRILDHMDTLFPDED